MKQKRAVRLSYLIIYNLYTLSNLLPPYPELLCIIHTVKPLVGTVMPTLRRVADMCSSTLSVNCESFSKTTQE